MTRLLSLFWLLVLAVGVVYGEPGHIGAVSISATTVGPSGTLGISATNVEASANVSASRVLVSGGGSAAAPVFSSSADTDTGWYISAGVAGRFTLNSSILQNQIASGLGLNMLAVNPSATLHVSGTTRITSWTTLNSGVTPSVPLEVFGTVSATGVAVSGTIAASTLSGTAVNGADISGSRIYSGGLLTGAAGANITGTVTATTVTATAVNFTNASGTLVTVGTVTATALNSTNASITSILANGVSTTGPVSASTAYVGGLTERVLSTAAGTSTTLINVSGAGLIVISPTVSTTISLTNALPGKSVQILVKQPSGGGVVITWASPTHHWANATYTSSGALTSTTQTTSGSTASQYSWTTDDGRNWYGGLAGSGM